MSDTAFHGYQDPTSGGSDLNAMAFLFKMLAAKLWTFTLVRVDTVVSAGEVAPVGFVGVTPMINQVDGQGGSATPHETIHGVPYFRLQGGADAVIIDPKVGDIGGAFFASRDISTVKATRAPAVPGSFRRFDPADALYIGGFLNGVPTQYVRFSATGIDVVSTTKVSVTAPTVEVTADHANVISNDVNLGTASGGKKVVLDGDPVSGGVVHSSATKVKAT